MRIALLGGTGGLGEGLSFRLKLAGYEVIVGSRDEGKAKERAENYNSLVKKMGGVPDIRGTTNERAAELADIAVITIPWKHAFDTVERLREKLRGKIVVSPIVPMEIDREAIYTPPEEGSAALKLAKILKESKVVVAFNNIPAKRFADPEERLGWDVVVCSNDEEAKKTVMEIISKIKGLRALDGGSLENSAFIESLTPFLINLAKRNGMKDISMKFL